MNKPKSDEAHKTLQKLEWHPEERIFLRQMSSDGPVNKKYFLSTHEVSFAGRNFLSNFMSI